MRKLKMNSLLAAGLAVAALQASATVSFDPIDGSGFIGRGDILSIDKTLVVADPDIRFRDSVLLEVTCAKNKQVGRLTRQFDRDRNINKRTEYLTRKASGNDNITGWILEGYAGNFVLDRNFCSNSMNATGWSVQGWRISSETGTGSLLFNGRLITNYQSGYCETWGTGYSCP